MAEGAGAVSADLSGAAKPRLRRRWPEWIAYGATVWSLAYGALGLYWTLGGAGFPFGAGNDPDALGISVLAGARAGTVAPVISALGFVGAVAATAMARGCGRGMLRRGLLGFAWILAAGLALGIPDYRVLVAVAYAPIALAGAPFGWPPVNYFEATLPWPVINQFVCIAGGLSWAAAAVLYTRRASGACVSCGRDDSRAGWTTPESASRWGRWAVYVSFVVPVLYAATRGAWALGIPLGITDEFLRSLQSTGLVWAGAGLAAVAVGGAVLTLGLIQWWGEVFPRWIPFAGGKPVPVWLAVVPAALVSVLVGAAGLMFVRLTLFGTFSVGETTLVLDENWAAIAPELLWPMWGAALGAATLAYYYRRRGACGRCGRG